MKLYVSKMDVKEYTLYQKWCEIQEKYTSIKVNDLWDHTKDYYLGDGSESL